MRYGQPDACRLTQGKLPIALGILATSGQLPRQSLTNYVIAGELALTGVLRPIRDALAMTYQLFQENLTPEQPFRPKRVHTKPF